jgi:hypothetical protein
MMFTRRAFGRTCIALWFGTRFSRAEERPPLSWVSHSDPAEELQRRYRADAQIILLSIPVLHRKGVGDGAAAWRDSIAEDGAVVRFLEFVGRSAPEHAAGLNRFGFIQELSRTTDQTKESLYFGLMTSSPEESAAEGRKALHSESRDASFSAIEGRIARDCIETASAHFIAPAKTSSADRTQLIERARVALLSAAKSREDAPSSEGMPGTFLHTLAAVLSSRGPAQTSFAFNGCVYRLRVERSPDAKATATFRDARLVSPAATVTRVTGTLWRKDGGKPSEFRLWIEDGNPRPLPLRIEYQPKAYLRLTFEAEE